MKKLNRKDLVDLVAEEGHLSKKEARQAVDIIFDHIADALIEGQEVNITNFGVFTPLQTILFVGYCRNITHNIVVAVVV